MDLEDDKGEDNSQDIEDWYDSAMIFANFSYSDDPLRLPTECHFCSLEEVRTASVIGFIYSHDTSYGVCRKHDDCLTLDANDMTAVVTQILTKIKTG